MSKFQKKLLIWLIIFIILSPLGLLLPYIFGSGDAWGEWDTETVEKMVGFIPKGMEKLSSLFKGMFSDYSNIFGENSPLILQIISYLISAIIGSLIIFLFFKLFFKLYKNISEPS
ncbi:MAG: cobalamin biosynthesis protein [Ignavibacteria bacterium]|nr:cobalamin biosynthesis protein [Ignavibacteria bacterium]